MDFPIGTIIAWDNAAIPDGWAVCDGNNGTPNLVGRFVRGAEEDGDLRVTGGDDSHYHTTPNTGYAGSHNHGLNFSLAAAAVSGVSGNTGTTATHAAKSHGHDSIDIKNISTAGSHYHSTPNTGLANNIPVHIKRVFIMRIS